MTNLCVKRSIYCAGCAGDVEARLTTGRECYPHRPDLADLPFWKCDACGNWVGCHHKTEKPTHPLGCIATPEIKALRVQIHRIVDPLFKKRIISRKNLYRRIADRLGTSGYHTGEIRSVEEAETVLAIVKKISVEIRKT